MPAVTPADLPPIDRVEIVDLRAQQDSYVGTFMDDSHASPCWSVAGEDARRISALWRDLPPGEGALCHTPPFGFRFYTGDSLVAEVSVCWAYSNLYGMSNGVTLSYEFDSQHPTAKQLLAEAQRISGIDVVR